MIRVTIESVPDAVESLARTIDEVVIERIGERDDDAPTRDYVVRSVAGQRVIRAFPRDATIAALVVEGIAGLYKVAAERAAWRRRR